MSSPPDGHRGWPDVPTAMIRVGQGGFAVLYTWKVLEAALSGLAVPMVTKLAVVAAFLTWVVGLLLARPRCTRLLAALIVIVDVGLIGIAASGAPGPSVVMVLVPAIGLPMLYGRRGVLLVLAAVILAVTVPTFFRHGPTALDLARAIVAAISTLGAASIAAIARETILERQDTITRQKLELEALLETVDVGLVLLDTTGELKTVNRRQRHFIDLVYPDGAPSDSGLPGLTFSSDGTSPLTAYQMPAALAMRGEEFDDLLLWCGAEPATRRAVSVSGRTVWDDMGRFSGAILSFNDVTDLLEALRLRDDFVANVSHELRTPLASITGQLELLLDGAEGPLSPPVAKRLEVVRRNAERLDRLVSDLLTSPAPSRTPSVGLIDAATHLRQAVESARSTAETSDLDLTLSAPPNLPMTMGAEAFNHIANNLIHNALKYSLPGGSVRVELAARGTLAELVVTDHGVGIPDHELDLVFTRFFRGRIPQEQHIRGVGLGLSIVKYLVEQHLGTVSVDSQEGIGTRFKVLLPRVQAITDEVDAERRELSMS